jgi:predicted phage-related endonuclease|tara:strand:- start:2093 stop:2743 length:651 start_codon:yes stop_codon:yes gene_type:complete
MKKMNGKNNDKKIGQIKKRPFGIGGSDANKLVHDNWLDLYNLKLGITKQDDLSDILPVQMGNATEQFNREWFEKQTQLKPTQEIQIWYNDYIYGNLDGIIKGKLEEEISTIAVFEAKHTNQFNNSEAKKLQQVDKYYPQLQHYMMCAKVNKAYLSMFFGNLNYDYLEIGADKDFQQKLLLAYDHFWKAILHKDSKEINTTWGEFHGITNKSIELSN